MVLNLSDVPEILSIPMGRYIMSKTLLAFVIVLAVLPAGRLSGQPQGDFWRSFEAAARPGWVGLSFRSSGPDAQVVIDEIMAGAPADRAGLRQGDRLIRWNGSTDVAESIRVTSLMAGDTVRVRVRRAGSSDRDLTMVAEARPFAFVMPQQVEEVSRQLRVQGDSLRIWADSIQARYRVMYRDSLMPMLERLQSEVEKSAMNQRAIELRGSIELQRYLERLGPDGSRPAPIGGDRKTRVEIVRARPLEGELERELTELQALQNGGLGLAVASGRSGVAGAELTELGAGLASYFAADRGVLVLRVAPQTPAAKAGLQEGDVIVRAAGQEVWSISDLRSALSGPSPQGVEVEVMRHQARHVLIFGR